MGRISLAISAALLATPAHAGALVDDYCKVAGQCALPGAGYGGRVFLPMPSAPQPRFNPQIDGTIPRFNRDRLPTESAEAALERLQRHRQWCAARYQTYRVADNSFQPTVGSRRSCNSPYG